MAKPVIDVRGGGAVPQGTSPEQVLRALQNEYGAQQYNDQQMTRYPYYSRVQYAAAGASQISFFGQSMGQITNLLTNSENPGSLGNVSFLIQNISFDFWVSGPNTTGQPQTYTTDATSIYSDIVHGFAQAGFWELMIGNVKWDQCPMPFLYRPPSNGRNFCALNQGGGAFTQSGMSPFAVTGTGNNLCYADLNRRFHRRGNLQNPLFLAPQQNFQATIFYPSGLIPIIATTVVASAAVLYVECILDGWKFSPVG